MLLVDFRSLPKENTTMPAWEQWKIRQWKMELADEFGNNNHASQQSVVKFYEIKPRMTL